MTPRNLLDASHSTGKTYREQFWSYCSVLLGETVSCDASSLAVQLCRMLCAQAISQRSTNRAPTAISIKDPCPSGMSEFLTGADRALGGFHLNPVGVAQVNMPFRTLTQAGFTVYKDFLMTVSRWRCHFQALAWLGENTPEYRWDTESFLRRTILKQIEHG